MPNFEFEDTMTFLVLSDVKKILEDLEIFTSQEIKRVLDDYCFKGMYALGTRGYVYHPLRVALSGRKSSPSPQDIAEILGKKETLARIDIALDKGNSQETLV